jgi:hypothetical protein
MKITKNQLRQIIKEEISKLYEKPQDFISIISEGIVIKEGATIKIDGLFNGDNPELNTILDICHEFRDVIYDVSPNTVRSMDDVSPDGNDAFESIGVVNFYPTGNYSREDLVRALKAVQKFAKKHGLVIGEIKAETGMSKMAYDYNNSGQDYPGPEYHKKGDDIKKIRVIRIPIIENNSFDTKLDQNSIHLGYGTIRLLFGDILGFNVEEGAHFFQFPAKEVKNRIEKTNLDNIDNLRFKNEKITYERYLKTIYGMAKYAVEHGYKTIGGA